MLPGGVIDEGELPLMVVPRELLEETDYVTNEWLSLRNYAHSSNLIVVGVTYFRQLWQRKYKNLILGFGRNCSLFN